MALPAARRRLLVTARLSSFRTLATSAKAGSHAIGEGRVTFILPHTGLGARFRSAPLSRRVATNPIVAGASTTTSEATSVAASSSKTTSAIHEGSDGASAHVSYLQSRKASLMEELSLIEEQLRQADTVSDEGDTALDPNEHELDTSTGSMDSITRSTKDEYARILSVPDEIFKEFLDAEKFFFSQRGFNNITVGQILECSKPEHLAPIILKELPARFAVRLQWIENIPEWREIPGLVDLYDIMSRSFDSLRLMDGDADRPSSEPLTHVVEDILTRHGAIVEVVTRAAADLTQRKVMDEHSVSEFVGQSMQSRIGTEMLLHHYMSLLHPSDESRLGIIDKKCNPGQICSDVVEHVRRNYFVKSKVSIRLYVDQAAGVEFSFISEYLFFILEELLLNSVKATVASAKPGRPPQGDISVTCCADARRLCIKISDKGGGIPSSSGDRIWDYMFTATPEQLQGQTRDAGGLTTSGLGLPLCKLYTEYLGGELELFSVPGIGVDVYVYFNRINVSGDYSLGGKAGERAASPR